MTVKAVGLNYLDAQKAAEVLLKIASQNGHIVIVPKSNTIIVCDVLSHAETMLAELVKLDQPTAGLIVEPIPLTHIEAKSAQEALAQIKEREYFARYPLTGKRLHLVGVNFALQKPDAAD